MTNAPRISIGVLALAASALLGCPSAPPADQDAGSPRDGMVVDSTLSSDASADGATASDSGVAMDAGAPSCGGSCDPRATTGCSPDTSCRFVSGVPACVAHDPDAGAGAAGSHCAYDADCADGLTCFANGGSGSCGRACCPTRDDCSATQRCRGDGMLVDGTLSAWARCLPPAACDLGHPDCATREGCYIVDGVGTTECLLAGSVATGGTCTAISDCAPGNVCTGLTTRTCVLICFLGSTAPHQGCQATEHCAAQAYSPMGTGICTAM